MASKWNGKKCPLCFEGTLHDGKRKQQLEYRGRAYQYAAKGAFCNHCSDGFPEHDAREEAAWAAFRDRVDESARNPDALKDALLTLRQIGAPL